MGSIPESRKSLGGEHGNTLQYSCLENPMDKGAWQATDHWVAEKLLKYACNIYPVLCLFLEAAFQSSGNAV